MKTRDQGHKSLFLDIHDISRKIFWDYSSNEPGKFLSTFPHTLFGLAMRVRLYVVLAMNPEHLFAQSYRYLYWVKVGELSSVVCWLNLGHYYDKRKGELRR